MVKHTRPATMRPSGAPMPLLLALVACQAQPGKDDADTALFEEPETRVGIPAGSFEMGSPVGEVGRMSDEGPRTSVTLAAFQLDIAPVTVERFTARVDEIVGAWKSEADTPTRYSGPCNLGTEQPAQPANCVSWEAATEFCALDGGRLPTEAEWEYAARAGTDAAYWWGESYEEDRAVTSVECGEDDCRSSTATVATEGDRCNVWGVCDTLGNVAEWMSTEYRDTLGAYTNEPMEPGAGDPALRGGSWSFADPAFLRVATRFLEHAPLDGSEFGFRCAYEAAAE
jgi:sulfatase modifying factor 1